MYHTHIYLSLTFVMPNPGNPTCWSCGLSVRLDMNNGCHPIIVDVKGVRHDTNEFHCTGCAENQPIRFVIKGGAIKLQGRHTALQYRIRMADEKRSANAQAMAKMRAEQAEQEAKMQAERAEQKRVQLVQELERKKGRTIGADIRKFRQFETIMEIFNECPPDTRTIHGCFCAFVGDFHHSCHAFGNPHMDFFYKKMIELLNSNAFCYEQYDDSGNECSDNEEEKPRVLELLNKIPVPDLTDYPYTRPMLPSPVYSRQEYTPLMIEQLWETALAAALEHDGPESEEVD
jgi:hypothetical protein